MKKRIKIVLLVVLLIVLCLSGYRICVGMNHSQKIETEAQINDLWQAEANCEKSGKSEDKVYEGYWELPFSEMVYAQENTVEMLLNEYKDISFEYRFPTGECKYKNYFFGLLKNDINFDETIEGKEISIDAD